MVPLVLPIVVLILAYWAHTRRRVSKLLPPGPPREPLLGNARHLKASYSWLYFSDLAEKYGDVVSVEVLGHPIVILSSLGAIEDLLIKQSAIFSGRPSLPMAGDLVGFSRTLALTSPGPRFQMFRKLMHQFMGLHATPRYHQTIEAQARVFVNRLFSSSVDLFQTFKFTIGSMILDLAYGIKADSPETACVADAEEAVRIFGEASQPGRFLVDTFPILKHVPIWFPLATFKLQAAEWRRQLDCQINRPLQQVKLEISKGVARSSFASQTLENPPPGVTEDIIGRACASLHGAAVDTTAAAIGSFVLAMVLHPEIQRKAQAELDLVFGSECLPTLANRKDLPFLEAVLKEVMRWHPVAPTNIPYRALEDCEYRGWVIPKDSTIIANCWPLCRDEKVYSKPEEFDPERFMNNPKLLDPRQYFYGFGRRICPGQHLADTVLWTTMATLLATSNMLKEVDEEGIEITPKAEFSGSQPSGPLPFPFKIEPRSKAVAAAIRDMTSHAA